jgi:hypothetical protein
MITTSTLGPLIGQGRMASIYASPDGRALKLFHPGIPRSTADYEAERGRLIYNTGITAPAVYESITLNDQHGYYMECIDGLTLAQTFARQPMQLIQLSQAFAEAHTAIHTRTAPDLTYFQEIFEHQCATADLPSELKSTALATLSRLPTGTTLLHGDFHPENILITPNRTVIIDWANACLGHPLADVARTAVILQVGGLPTPFLQHHAMRFARSLFLNLYLRRYRQLNPYSPEDLNNWLFILTIHRLFENISGEREALLALAKRYQP